jgi:AraC-like DNA-binding protein
MDGTGGSKLIEAAGQRPLPSHVKRALAYMRDNIGEKITLEELASACAVPERILLRQFQRFLGVPPLTYLRRLRLNTARSELARPDNNDAISDIAIRCGFNHLGRFATEYRRLFNETPSATRQRARASAAGSGANSAASPPCRDRPSLPILPLRTETLQGFDGSAHDPFELQDRVVDHVLCSVVAHITDAEIQHANSKDPNDLTARDLAMQALPLARATNVTSSERAVAMLTRAVAINRADAMATGLLAYCHAQLANYHATASVVPGRDMALRLAQRAGLLDNGDPLVTIARGSVASLTLQAEEEDALAMRALAMDPTSARGRT